MNRPPLLASELFAMLHGEVCDGPDFCHWCGAPCQRKYEHDDKRPTPFQRHFTTARLPHNPWICLGCYLWRRTSITVNFLNGGFKDRQTAQDHSWWLTEDGMWGLRDGNDYQILWERLLKPPKRFLLCLRGVKQAQSLLHLLECNDLGGILAETPLKWTLDNRAYVYTVYELTEVVKTGDTQGTEPGVRLLVETIGKAPVGLLPEEKVDKRGRGRPSTQATTSTDRTPKKVITASGNAT